ncbi:MAG: hypothetical protein AAF363_12325 [Bacteroidota bacterium]
MDDIGNIVYIVFLVIYLLSRAFKKKKPKQPPTANPDAYEQTESQPTQRPKKQLTFEEMLREFTEGAPPEEPEVLDEPVPEPTPRQYDDQSISEKYQSSIDQAKKFKTIDEQVELERKPLVFDEFDAYDIKEDGPSIADEVRESLQNLDDARKAIILKEVLDRKF